MRSCWKLPFTLRRLNRLSLANDASFVDDNVVFLRRFLVPRSLESRLVSVYNGIDLVDILILSGKVGHKLGEFSVTKILGEEYRDAFGRKKKKKKNKKNKGRKK